jgi:hypothetical protein
MGHQIGTKRFRNRSEGKRGQGEKPKGFVPLRPLQGPHCGVHPEAGGTWLCVQHEEDGANACTCADESI